MPLVVKSSFILASLRSKLDRSYSFDFLDGSCDTIPPPEIKRFYSAPYRSYWEGSNVADTKASFKLIEEKLKKNGPYDGVLAFSQGAALIASYLLYLKADNKPSPFKFAIFIAAGVPTYVLEDIGVHVSQEARMWEKKMSLCLDGAVRGSLDHHEKPPYDEDFAFDRNISDDPRNTFGLDTLQPAVRKLRISIPTVHIYGSKDPVYPLSRQLVRFCDSTCSRIFDHGEGHVIPRKRDVSDRIRALVKWAAETSDEVW